MACAILLLTRRVPRLWGGIGAVPQVAEARKCSGEAVGQVPLVSVEAAGAGAWWEVYRGWGGGWATDMGVWTRGYISEKGSAFGFLGGAIPTVTITGLLEYMRVVGRVL
jgi:hypothetical protein